MATFKVTLLSLVFCAFAFSPQRSQGNDCTLNTRLIQRFKFPQSSVDYYSSITLSYDGRKMACTYPVNYSGFFVDFWDGVTQVMLRSHFVYGTKDMMFSFFKLSPSLQYGVLYDQLVDFKNGFQLPIPNMSHTFPLSFVAWRRDEKVMAISEMDVGGQSFHLTLRHASSGVPLINWTISGLVMDICWSPSPFISISMMQLSSRYYLLQYYPNGTMKSQARMAQSSSMPISCNPDGLVAVTLQYSLALMNVAGDILTQDIQGQTHTSSLRETVLGVCGAANSIQSCKVYDTRLQLLLEVTETLQHTLVGFSPDERTLITLFNGSLHWWDIQTPHLREQTTSGPSAMQVQVQWLDRDHVLIDNRELYNMRTGELGPNPFPNHLAACGMHGRLYAIFSGNTTNTIFVLNKDAQEIAEWTFPEDYVYESSLQCSYSEAFLGALAKSTASGRALYRWFAWTSSGVLIQSVPVEDWEFFLSRVVFCNPSHLVFVLRYEVFFWNPETSQLEPTIYRSLQLTWSPNGRWLALFLELLPGIKDRTLAILNGERKIVKQVTVDQNDNLSDLSWSADSNWLILAGSPLLLISPSLNIIYPLQGGTTAATFAYWNPETMEIMSRLQGTLRVFIPTPSRIELVASTEVESPSPTQIMIIGAAYLPRVVKTMIRWVDSSTGVPQCLILNGTVVDTMTVSLGNLSLPDPAMYTVHLAYPTMHPTSPWFSSQSQHAAVCRVDTLPAINQTGGVTSCVCPNDRYTAPPPLIISDNNTHQLKCETCPLHSQCNGSSIVLSDEGYWPTTENPYQFLRCVAGACKGKNECFPCYEGPLCGLCQVNCGQHGFGKCQACNPIGMNILFIVLGLLCWIGFCILQSLFALGWRNKKSRGNNSTQLAAIIVSTTQANALLLSVNVNAGSLSKLLGFTEERIQGGGVQSSISSCVLIHFGWKPSEVHFVKQVIMLLLPVLALVVLQIAHTCCVRCRRGSNNNTILTSTDIIKVPTIIVWSSLQSAITTSLFQTISCKDVQSQGFKFRLSHDISVACYGSSYWSFIGIVTIPGIVITIIIIPLTTAWFLRYRPSSGYLRFLVKSYRVDWWYLMVFYRKVLISVVVTSTQSAFHVAITLLLSSVLHIMIWPSTSFLVNVSEAVSLVNSAFLFGVAGVMDLKKDLSGGTNFGSLELISVAAFSYCVQFGLLVYDRCRHSTPSTVVNQDGGMAKSVDRYDDAIANNQVKTRLLVR